MCEVCPPGIVYCIIFLQQQQHHHAILINSHVIMESVSQITTGVMVLTTVETIVMKMDVVQVHVCTIS